MINFIRVHHDYLADYTSKRALPSLPTIPVKAVESRVQIPTLKFIHQGEGEECEELGDIAIHSH